MRVSPTGVHLPGCHHLSPGPISCLLPGLSTPSLNRAPQTHTQSPDLTVPVSTQGSEPGGDMDQAACLADAGGC